MRRATAAVMPMTTGMVATTMDTITATDPTRMTMADGASRPVAGLLRTLWLASPTLPVGGFSYSEGLEAAVKQMEVEISKPTENITEGLRPELEKAAAFVRNS